jgi:hypothetical protein
VTRQITTEWEHLAVGEVREGQFLRRVGLKIVGADVSAMQGPKGDKGDPGEPGQSIEGPAGQDGQDGAPGDVSACWPVGSVFIAVVETNPGTLLGFGTWVAFAAGRMLIGLNASDADFDTAEETGGAKASSALIAHTHLQDPHTHVQDAHTHVQNAHSHIITSQTATTGAATSYEHGTLDTSSAEAEATETTAAATAVNQNTTAVNQNATAVNQSAGSGNSFSLMNPYIVVYMWKRTA